jgi:peptidyl-prolyl cis-trans isomerase B (cyclophilin B)
MTKTQHKAASQVTLIAHEEKSGFAQWVDRNWPKAALIAAVVSGAILFMQFQEQQSADAASADWTLFDTASTPEAFAEILPQLEGRDAYSWALLLQAQVLVNERRYDEAVVSLNELKGAGNPALTVDTIILKEGGEARTFVDHALANIEAQQAWEAQYPTLFENPALAADASKVTMKTTEGDIVIALYADRAPKHVANFIAKCELGAFNGTKFHQVVEGRAVMGGDPNTKEGDVSNWGQGGFDETVEAEDEETGLSHFSGVLSANKGPGALDSSAMQFTILLQPFHGFDSQRTVFGQVVEGMDVLEVISASELEDETQGRPADPVAITATLVTK